MDYKQNIFQGVERVVVIKRNLAGTEIRFKGIELRMGNADESGKDTVQLSANPLVGFHQGPVSDRVVIIEFFNKATGRYLTLQTIEATQLEIAEIDVFFPRD